MTSEARDLIALCVLEIAIKKAVAHPSPLYVSDALHVNTKAYERALIDGDAWMRNRRQLLDASPAACVVQGNGWSMIDLPNGGHPCTMWG